MLFAASALKVYALEASDGRMGSIDDLLFDDRTWKVRWVVVDTGKWLTGRKVLIHPSAFGRRDDERKVLPVALTKAQVEASPDIRQDEPVSQQMESQVFDYYGWDPYWGPSYFAMGEMASPFAAPPFFGDAGLSEAARNSTSSNQGDPYLRSVAEVTGYHIHATDGAIGHAQDFLVDDEAWDIRYLVIDTRNWLPGKHVLMSPYAVKQFNYPDREIHLDVTCDQVKNSPPWDPAGLINRAGEERLHAYYDWPGYGF